MRTLISTRFTLVLLLCLSFACGASPEPAYETDSKQLDLRDASKHDKPTIVLVHGAWAGALSWQKVIRLLQDRGYRVVAVDNPLTSLTEDIANTARVVDAEAAKGALVLVGHSLGGAVIGQAAAKNAAVKALVYINAFAPDEFETIGELAARAPAPLGEALVPDAAGFLRIDETKFRDVFCADVPSPDARVMAAAQKPVFSGAFSEPAEHAAWRDIPSWYLLGLDDRSIPPETQRFMAERMNARVTTIHASHASYISHPFAVFRMIDDAASSSVR